MANSLISICFWILLWLIYVYGTNYINSLISVGRTGGGGRSRSRATMASSAGGASSSLVKNESYMRAVKIYIKSLDIQLEKQLAKTWRSTRGRTTRDRGRTGRSTSPSFYQPKENHVPKQPQQIAEHRRYALPVPLIHKLYWWRFQNSSKQQLTPYRLFTNSFQ
jgi:hypothetical protein